MQKNPNDSPLDDNPAEVPADWHLMPEGDDDMQWLSDPSDEELNKMRDFAMEGAYIAGNAALAGEGVTREALDAWFSSLPEDKQTLLDADKREAEEYNARTEKAVEAIERSLSVSAPELLRGELPAVMAAKITAVADDYVLGINQSGQATAGEAQLSLNEEGGIPMFDYQSLQKRFLLIHSSDPEGARTAVVNGYYGPTTGGKFVIAVPIEGGEGSPYERAEKQKTNIDDLTGQSLLNSNFTVLRPKYVAGFIDASGEFHPNAHFMDNQQAAAIQTGSEQIVPVDVSENWV